MAVSLPVTNTDPLKHIAISKTIIRIIHALFAENIIDTNSNPIHFTLKNRTNKSIEIKNENDAFRFIYCYDTYINYNITYHTKRTSVIINNVKQLFDDIIEPFYATKNNNTNLKIAYNEILNSIENEALSIAIRKKTFKQIISANPNCNNICDWFNTFNTNNTLQLDKYITQLSVFTGHRFH
eukprot:268667_1